MYLYRPTIQYNKDEFVYPDKFDKEEAEVLGLANLSESDFARMDFSFKTKKSHNGWLAFMYPRLLLARDLLSKDGVIFISIDDNEQANLKLLCDDVFGEENFLLKRIISLSVNSNETVLDFFAGSGTTGHAVMQLNSEDGAKRKFILCQIDEPIKEDKPAYKFCIDNNLPPAISSITVERLKRAGEKIAIDIEEENSKTGLFEADKKQIPDIGFKVFDSVEAPKLKVDEKGQISITENETDALSRIYNMIFTVGLDETTQIPEEILKDKPQNVCDLKPQRLETIKEAC
jgi:adenine specific DNA methylase Mod